MHRSIKPIAQVLLLLLAIHAHIQAVGSTTETSVSLANLKHKTSSEINYPVWRRELRGGGGHGGGGHSGGHGGHFNNGSRSAGLQSCLFMLFISYWVLYN